MAGPWDQYKGGSTGTPGGGTILSDPLAERKDAREAAGAGRDEARLGLAYQGDARSNREAIRSGQSSLRKEFNDEKPVINYKEVAPLYAAALKTPADKGGDLSLVYHFAKILDPGSAVREGEMTNIQATDTRLNSAAQRALTELRGSGGTFTDKARNNIRNAIRIVVDERRRAYDLERSNFEQIAKEQGYDPQLITGKRFDEPFQRDIDSYWENVRKNAKAEAPPVELNSGPNYATDQDIEIARRAQGIWDNGGTVDDVNAFFKEQGLPPLSQADGDKLRALPPGSPAIFQPAQSGRRSPTEQAVATVANGPVGAGAVLAANGATFGLLDELAPIVGMDPQRIEQSKDALRDANPVSSFVGEMVGGVAGMGPLNALTRGALPGISRGAADLTADILYGAGYGAGESNDNRLLGATFGGAVSGAAGGIARKAIGEAAPAADDVLVNPARVPAPEAPPSNMMMPTDVPVASGTPPVAAAPAAPTPPPGMAPVEPMQLGQLVSLASGTGSKASVARTKLAEMAAVNPQAMQAAQRLGIDVPADVFSDNPQIREAIGLTRAVAGSDASAQWIDAVRGAVDRADDVMREFDANFVEGAISPATVSDAVKARLTGEHASLGRNADAVYRKVDEAIPMETPVNLDRTFETIQQIAGEVGADGMSAAEKRLMGMIQSGEAGAGDITYGRLRREKNLMRQAMERKESPYGNMDHAALKRLYDAISADQLENVGRVGGEDLRKELRAANLLWAKRAALGTRIVNAFGEDQAGSISNKMRDAIAKGAKGETGELTRLLKLVPEDLRRETVSTALASATRANGGMFKGGFGFSEFADLYPKLRANPEVYKQIVEALGPESAERLRDLYSVSKRLTDARAAIPTTGKANQALLMGMRTEGLVRRIMGSPIGRRGAEMVAGGGLMGMGAGELTNFLASRTDGREAAGKLFASPEFQNLLVQSASKPQVPDQAVAKVAASRPFTNFADRIGVPKTFRDRANWIRQALTQAAVMAAQPPREEAVGTSIQIGGR